MILLLPADPLRPRRPDGHFAAEAGRARENGLAVALVDHDELTRPHGAGPAIARVPRGGLALYRGWMLSSRQYEAFAQALRERDVTLVTDPARYRRAHELPGWYEALREVTPRTVWSEGADLSDGFDEACRRLGPGPAVLRDHTKSMKHYWHEAAFIPRLADPVRAEQVLP
ncbi:hypothetical protein KIH74_06000 [Kineosporia sp. J2-2]|uniref:Uncharacterized protein n=1 Tax=Kineosporia corallincola TaxID=2835133 RepID=A0ABS5TBK9_9ACTN|nr:hypothetical protein [Kineosporia corallincola]MBT0768468.1 hypothetical protein [Kineosporia corallincola]